MKKLALIIALTISLGLVAGIMVDQASAFGFFGGEPSVAGTPRVAMDAAMALLITESCLTGHMDADTAIPVTTGAPIGVARDTTRGPGRQRGPALLR